MTPVELSVHELEARLGQPIAARSWVQQDDLFMGWLEETTSQPAQIVILAPPEHPVLARFPGQAVTFSETHRVKRCPPDHAAAQALQHALPALRPRPLGLVPSFGFGDRLGLATRGHIRALLRMEAETPGFTIAPVFAQQSVRELARTDRTPEQVMDAAVFGAFAAGWHRPVGADADHLKTTADIDRFAAAGFSFFTLDPSAFVREEADRLDAAALAGAAEAIPWEVLQTSLTETIARYADQPIDLGIAALVPERIEVVRAVVKYGGALAHVVTLYRHLVQLNIPFEIEISVDETETPTSVFEHVYIAAELRRLGVTWVSLAPRFVGRFEKGVDYIGDRAAIAQDLQLHAAAARTLGPYKLSLHSGSDKFSIYGAAAAATAGLLHIKTAGTSYLEALRVAAERSPELFRQIAALAWAHYETDRQSYHVSARRDRLPELKDLTDASLPPLLDDHDVRQALHVTFGTVMRQYRRDLLLLLQQQRDAYEADLEGHFYRHLAPLAAALHGEAR
ncbi:MAG: tagaturonate epimerase family protein [Candidatus Flexifilum sp.]